MDDKRLLRIEQLGAQAMEHAALAGMSGKLYSESLDLFSAAAINKDEKGMEAARLAAHQAVDDLLDSRLLIQKCSDEQKELLKKFR